MHKLYVNGILEGEFYNIEDAINAIIIDLFKYGMNEVVKYKIIDYKGKVKLECRYDGEC